MPLAIASGIVFKSIVGLVGLFSNGVLRQEVYTSERGYLRQANLL